MHRKSIEEHKANGTYKPGRHDKFLNEQPALAILPPPPFALTEAAKAIYKEEGQRLISQGCFKPTDLRLLAAYASEMSVYVSLMATAQEEGIIIELANGISTANAHRKAAESALKNAAALADRLGISAIGRRRLGIGNEPAEKPDPIADLLGL